MAVMVGAGAASRRGILIKSAAALEQAGRSRQVVFDKTGTLTTGRPEVTRIDRTDAGTTDDEVLRLAAAVEAALSMMAAGADVVDLGAGDGRKTALLLDPLVAAGNAGDPELIPLVRRHAEGPDELLAEHAGWALARLKRGACGPRDAPSHRVGGLR